MVLIERNTVVVEVVEVVELQYILVIIFIRQ